MLYLAQVYEGYLRLHRMHIFEHHKAENEFLLFRYSSFLIVRKVKDKGHFWPLVQVRVF